MSDQSGPPPDPRHGQPPPSGGSQSQGILIGVLATVSALALIALVGVLVFFVLGDEDEGTVAVTSPTPTATPDTSPPRETSSPETASPEPTPASDPVVLGPRGLKAVSFGASPADTVAALRPHLGDPEEETPWEDSHTSQFGVCPGDEVRGVRWATLFVLFADGDTRWTSSSTARRHFFAYIDSEFHGRGAVSAPHPLRTSRGIGIGSTVADLRRTYGSQLSVRSSEVFGDTFGIEGGPDAPVGGSLSGRSDTDVVRSIWAGQLCGE